MRVDTQVRKITLIDQIIHDGLEVHILGTDIVLSSQLRNKVFCSLSMKIIIFIDYPVSGI